MTGIATHLSSSKDLTDQEIDTDRRYPSQQLFTRLWPPIQPLLCLLISLTPTAFHHVRHQRPRRPTEPDQRDFPLQGLPGQIDRLEDVPEFLVHIDVLGQPSEIFRGSNRVGKGRRWVHLDGQTHGFGDDEDIAKDDGGVEETFESTDRLHGQFAGDLGGLAAFEKAVIFPDSEEFCGGGGLCEC